MQLEKRRKFLKKRGKGCPKAAGSESRKRHGWEKQSLDLSPMRHQIRPRNPFGTLPVPAGGASQDACPVTVVNMKIPGEPRHWHGWPLIGKQGGTARTRERTIQAPEGRYEHSNPESAREGSLTGAGKGCECSENSCYLASTARRSTRNP